MNPEIRKNILLELTITRVATLVVAYVLVLTIFFNAKNPLEALGDFASVMLVVFMALGLVRCSNTVATEVQDNTWDFQRMSSAGAWELTVGKLVGAPIFATCGASMALGLLMCLMVAQGTPLDVALRLLLILPSTYLFICAIGVGRSLLSAQEMRSQRRVKFNIGALAVILLLGPLLGLAIGLAKFIHQISTTSSASPTTSITWWGMQFLALDFITLSVLLFTAWSILGAYRLMRAELQFKQLPIAWILFCCFLWLYITPLWPLQNPVKYATAYDLLNLPGPLLSCILLYPELCSGFKDIVALRRFVTALSRYQVAEAFSLMPRWIISLLFFIAATALSILFAQTSSGQALLAAWCLFVIRDVAVIMSFHIKAPNHRRNGMAALVYFVFLYALGPLLVAIAHGSLVGLFFPIEPTFSLIGSTIGAAAALILVIRAWKVQ